MSLADDLHTAREVARRNKCASCGFYASLTEADRAEFDAAVADPELSLTELWRVCSQNGLTIKRSVFTDHMRDHYGRP